MPHARATGHPPSSPNPLHEPVNALAGLIQRTKRAIPRRTTPAEQIALLAPILQELQQHEAVETATNTSSRRATSIYYDQQLHFENIYEPAPLQPLQRIPVRGFFDAWVAAVGQRRRRRGRLGLQGQAAEEINTNGREMGRGPWAPPALMSTQGPGSVSNEVQHPDLDPDCTWMRNFDATTPLEPCPVSQTASPRAIARDEAVLFSRWLRASAMSTGTSTYVGSGDAEADAMATVVYASSPPPPPPPPSPSTSISARVTTATGLWRVLLRLVYELLRHLPRPDMLFPRRERGRLSREAFRRFLALATSASIQQGTGELQGQEQEQEDALEAGIRILEALAGLANRDNDNENDNDNEDGHDVGDETETEADVAEAEVERERIRMAREHRQLGKEKRRQQPMVLVVDLTEVPIEMPVETTDHRHRSGLMRPLPSRHNSEWAPVMYWRFVEALEAFTERNRAALFLVGRDGVCRMRVAFC